MRYWRHSFVTRLGALFALLIVAVVLTAGWLRDRANRAYLLQDQQRLLTHRAEIIRVRFQSAIDAVRKDVLYLSRTPAIRRLASAATTEESEAARREAAVYFKELLEVRPSYFQARLIGVADEGREVIRFDRTAGAIHEVRDLQRKGDRDYFRETMALPPGQFYFSEINLNQEYGQVSEPHTPTLRASVPIADARGARVGLVILNVEVRDLFAEMNALAGPELTALLCNGRGDYLLHPDEAKCFGFDLGRRANLFDDDPSSRPGLKESERPVLAPPLVITSQFPITWDAARSLILRLEVPQAPLLARVRAQRVQHLAVTLFLAALAASAVLGATALVARRLRRVARAVEEYEPGGPWPDLPAHHRDEVGILTGKFRDMAAKIREQMGALELAKQRAEAATRARDEFLDAMSHEIRTPMNAVLGIAHLIDDGSGAAQQAQRLRTLKTAGRNLVALLNNLLDRDRVEAGDFLIDTIPFDLRELLESLHQSLEPLAARKGLAFRFAVEAAVPRQVLGDSVRLFQILNNLAHNAIKFTEHGHVALRVTWRGAGQVGFEVTDTGPGLPPPIAAWLSRSSPKAGEACRAESADESNRSDWKGLGLRISRRLIELMGGQLQATTSPAGASLVFVLPWPEAPLARRADGAAFQAPPDLADYEALAIEDVPSNRVVLEGLLEKTGLRCEFVASAAEAGQAIRNHRYDFAFLDLQLPDGTGAALADELIRLQPELRVVAVSAQVCKETWAACQAAGVCAFVPKPIEPSELYAKLRALTAPRLESVVKLLDGQESRITEYFQRLDREWDGWEEELPALAERADAERLGRLHHRMKNALRQLELWKLDRTLELWRESMAPDAMTEGCEWSARALRLMAAARPAGSFRLSRSIHGEHQWSAG